MSSDVMNGVAHLLRRMGGAVTAIRTAAAIAATMLRLKVPCCVILHSLCQRDNGEPAFAFGSSALAAVLRQTGLKEADG